MIFTLSFKTPDVLDYVMLNRSDEERELMQACADKFLEYNEYIGINFDTDTNTATVIPIK